MSEQTPQMGDDTERLAGEIARVAPELLRPHILSQRWFADKDRELDELSIVDFALIQRGESVLYLAIVNAQFVTGLPSLYAVPLLLTPNPVPIVAPWFAIALGEKNWYVSDALGSEFGRWLLESIEHRTSTDTANGVLEATKFFDLSREQLTEHAEPASTEQSNSSMLYASMNAKIYRRLSEGENPDVAVGHHLTGKPSFHATPQLYGAIEYVGLGGRFTLAMLQERIESPSDGWTLLLQSLADDSPLMQTIGAELGQLTAEMHLALASPTDDPAFALLPTLSDTVELWRSQTVETAREVFDALSSTRETQTTATRQLIDHYLQSSAEIVERSEGYELLLGWPLIRVHGDYHLGQVLLDSYQKWWVIDFEGEPLRPIHERIRKTSPLKDVAGMLRSFAYARGAAQSGGASVVELGAWEQRTRQEFLDTYLTVLRRGQPELLPLDDDQLLNAIRAWELDKALYEVMYELSSRPDWLWLPLSSIVGRSTGLDG